MFLEGSGKTYYLKRQFKAVFRQITYLQGKLRDQMAIKESKLEVLMIYWDKLLNQIQARATKLKD